MKATEERNTCKEEGKEMNKVPAELTEEELDQVSGGVGMQRIENVELYEEQ